MFKNLLTLFDSNDYKQFSILAIGLLVLSIVEILGIASIIPFMSIIIDPNSIHSNIYLSELYNYFSFDDESEFAIYFGYVVIFVLIVSNGYGAFMAWVTHHYTNFLTYKLATGLLKKYITQDYVFFFNRNTSELSKNIFTEVDRIVGGVLIPLISVFTKIITSLLILSALIYVDPVVAFISILILGGSYLIIFKLIHIKLKTLGVKTTELSGLRYKIASESMLGIKAIILHNIERKFTKRFESTSLEYFRNIAESSVISSLPRYALETISFSGIILIALFVSKGDNNHNTLAMLSLYALAGYKLLPALQGIYQSVTQIKYNKSAIDLLMHDFSLASRNMDTQQENIVFNRTLALDDVSYKYHGNELFTLSNISLNIDVNTSVGVVGSTGSGKSTLIDVLTGLLSPTFGKLKIDNKSLDIHTTSEWYKHIGYVPQDIYMMDSSIASNIALGVDSDKIDYHQINKVLKQADLYTFVNTLADGYNEIIGEQGIKISGGQKQRIGIARALYHAPDVLVFDEATSSLDRITELKIMNSIYKLSKGKTIVIIAHRISTIKNCDVIYVMDQGKIIDSGSFEYLVSNCKIFNKLSKI